MELIQFVGDNSAAFTQWMADFQNDVGFTIYQGGTDKDIIAILNHDRVMTEAGEKRIRFSVFMSDYFGRELYQLPLSYVTSDLAQRVHGHTFRVHGHVFRHPDTQQRLRFNVLNGHIMIIPEFGRYTEQAVSDWVKLYVPADRPLSGNVEFIPLSDQSQEGKAPGYSPSELLVHSDKDLGALADDLSVVAAKTAEILQQARRFVQPAVLLEPVDILRQHGRISGICRKYGIRYVGQLVQCHAAGLARYRCSLRALGKKGVADIQQALAKYGCSLDMDKSHLGIMAFNRFLKMQTALQEHLKPLEAIINHKE